MFSDQSPLSLTPPPPPPPPPQQPTKKYKIDPVKNRCEKWYLDADTADVHFTFGSIGTEASPSSSSKRLGAHKILLATDSDVFKAMFFGDLKENDDIHLADATEAAFKEFLQFFYLNEVELSIASIPDLMHLGHKYLVANCIDVCVQFLKDYLTVDSAVFILSLAMLYDHRELMKMCERFIVLNTIAIIKSSGFLECDRRILAHILNGNLFICSEVELFEACMEWVKAKSGYDVLSKAMVDEHLGELFYGIRFGTMGIEEFCGLATKYNAVLSVDFQTIANLIGLPEFQQDKFNTERRQVKWIDDDGTIVKNDRQCCDLEDWFTVRNNEVTKFATSKPLLLTEFTYSRLDRIILDHEKGHDPSNLSVEVGITESIGLYGPYEFILKTNVRFSLGSTGNVSLPRPILIKPGFFYRISIRLSHECDCYSKELKKQVQLESDDAIIEFYDCHEFNKNDSDNDDEEENKDDNDTVAGIISAMGFWRI